MSTYSITVYAGLVDQSGAYEAARGDGAPNIQVTLFGSKASSPELDVGSGGGEPGGPAPEAASNRFTLADLGDIQRVRVRHDDTGVGPGCYLDRVVVQLCGSLEEWTFVCRRWLGRHADDGATERTLDAAVA